MPLIDLGRTDVASQIPTPMPGQRARAAARTARRAGCTPLHRRSPTRRQRLPPWMQPPPQQRCRRVRAVGTDARAAGGRSRSCRRAALPPGCRRRRRRLRPQIRAAAGRRTGAGRLPAGRRRRHRQPAPPVPAGPAAGARPGRLTVAGRLNRPSTSRLHSAVMSATFPLSWNPRSAPRWPR